MDGTGRNVMPRSALMLMQSTFARVACEQSSPQALHALRASVDQARALPADAAWDRKAAAHAEFHHLLVEATGASGYALIARSIGGSLREMITLAGPAAEDLIIASRRRMLRHLACRDADGAAREMEDHMTRLSRQVLVACIPQMRAGHGGPDPASLPARTRTGRCGVGQMTTGARSTLQRHAPGAAS